MTESTIAAYQTRHEKILKHLIIESNIPATNIHDAMLYALFPGGKRLRPLLVYLCGELIGVSLESLDIIAAAVEMIHAYSLIHDDLPAMDNDDLRRGRPTCHRAFNEAVAILAGDGLQALAIDVLLNHLPKSLSLPQVIAVTHILVQACGPEGMVSGQSLDLSLSATQNIDAAQLQRIHHLKTGQLILACINMVLAAGSAAAEEATGLRQFANDLGYFFQMQDDYLDRYGSRDSLGKGRSSDAVNQKQTFATEHTEPVLAEILLKYSTKTRAHLQIFGKRAQNLLILLDTVRMRTPQSN